MKQIVVNKNEAGQRMDKLLAKYLNKAPKSFLYKMLRKKNITLNGKKAEGNEILVLQDEIKLFLSDDTIAVFSEIRIPHVKSNLAIIYEDKNILLLNKPAGMLSQKAFEGDISLVEHIISYMLETKQLKESDLQSFRPGVCNRLDRNTSGLTAAGKTLRGLQDMAEVIKNRKIGKFYRCLAVGELKEKKLIEGWLLKEERTNHVQILRAEQKGSLPIITEYLPVVWGHGVTLLDVNLITGRSHQIRAHLSSIGHPILGDPKYGNQTINQQYLTKYGLKGQLLHSYRMVFPEMKGELENLSGKEFTAPLPDMFQKILDVLEL